MQVANPEIVYVLCGFLIVYDLGFIVDIVLFEFAKTFNVVSHHLLLDKLNLLGICSPLIDSIADFIIGHVMRISDVCSSLFCNSFHRGSC